MIDFSIEDFESNKKVIQLPENLKYSSQEKQLVIISYRDLHEYCEYWKSFSKEKKFSLYEQLSQDIIERPYVDAPYDRLEAYGKIAYHTNHGTTHGIRQAELTRHYLRLIQLKGTVCSREVANSVTDEEYACLELAAFLFRSGRTNEDGWQDDSTYGPRSAAIFKQIAMEFNFSPILVDLISSHCFDYHANLVLEQPLDDLDLEQTRGKINLFRSLLKLSHESDLVRCFENYENVASPIVVELSKLIASEEITDIADSFLRYAVKLCHKTGAPVIGAKEDTHIKTENRILAVETAIAPKSAFYSLLGLKPECLPGLVSPTERWITSSEHAEFDGGLKAIKAYNKCGALVKELSAGWSIDDIKAIPTEECIAKEKEYLETHVSVYHATKKENYVLDLFCRKLKSLAGDSRNTAWIRNFHSNPRGLPFENVHEMKKLMSGGAVDESDNNAWHLLSCSPTLWQNADRDSQESTVDYYYNNNSVLSLDFFSIFSKLLDDAGLLVGYNQDRAALYKQFLTLVQDSKYGQQGVIYQYLIPHSLVEEIAYISKENGIVDEENPEALETLLQMKMVDGLAPNQNKLQVRLFVPKLIDPTLFSLSYPNTLIVFNYLNMNDEMRQEFEERISALAETAFHGYTQGVKVKVDEDGEKKSYVFNLLNSLQKKSYSDDDNVYSLPVFNNDSSLFLWDDNFIFTADDSDEEENQPNTSNRR